jgi:hypothetical protein
VEFEAAERPVVGVEAIARLGDRRPREGSCQHDFAGLQALAPGRQLHGQPGHADGRVALHAGGQAGLFDRAVLPQDGAAPGQVDLARLHRRPPSTMPALAALSLMVSCTLRMTRVWRSNCSMRASMISMAGVT